MMSYEELGECRTVWQQLPCIYACCMGQDDVLSSILYSSFFPQLCIFMHKCVCVRAQSLTYFLPSIRATQREKILQSYHTPLLSLALFLDQHYCALPPCPSLLPIVVSLLPLSLFYSPPLTLFNHVCAHRTICFSLSFILALHIFSSYPAFFFCCLCPLAFADTASLVPSRYLI